MFGGKKDSKSDFLNNAKLERKQRQDSKKKETAIVKIQVNTNYVLLFVFALLTINY